MDALNASYVLHLTSDIIFSLINLRFNNLIIQIPFFELRFYTV